MGELESRRTAERGGITPRRAAFADIPLPARPTPDQTLSPSTRSTRSARLTPKLYLYNELTNAVASVGSEVVGSGGDVVAHYEHAPLGFAIRQSGVFSQSNVWLSL